MDYKLLYILCNFEKKSSELLFIVFYIETSTRGTCSISYSNDAHMRNYIANNHLGVMITQLMTRI